MERLYNCCQVLSCMQTRNDSVVALISAQHPPPSSMHSDGAKQKETQCSTTTCQNLRPSDRPLQHLGAKHF